MDNKEKAFGLNRQPSSGDNKEPAVRRAKMLTLIIYIVPAVLLVLSGALIAGSLIYRHSHIKLDGRWLDTAAVEELHLEQMPDGDELDGLARCEGLKLLDMRAASISAEEHALLSERLPGCEVRWMIPMGGKGIDSGAEELSLGDIPREEWDKIEWLTRPVSIDMSGCTDYEALTALAAEYPHVEITWTVDVLGQTFRNNTADIDLSGAAVEDADAFAAQLQQLPALASLDLSGSSLSAEQIAGVKQALPGCEVTWTYTLYGKEHSSAETELDFRGTGITDLSELGAMLPYLDHVERVYLTDLDIPSKKIEAMADAFPEVKFVWRLRVVFWSVMTDAKSFSTRNYDPPSYRLSSREAEKLRYCDELEALDLGHNGITDLSFVKHMPGLKILILADNEVRDISALSELKELEYIELFKNHITDLTPLTKLPKLQDLNLCYNRIQDFSPLCEMSGLKRLWLNGTKVDKATAAELTESLPDCRIVTDGDHSTSSGWREHERYDWMIACFN